MDYSEPINKLFYEYEILQAKLEIRDHYLKNLITKIFENTGQMLFLARVQLATIGSQTAGDVKTRLQDSGNLVGLAIHDLRVMCNDFYPENELLSESGLINALKRELGVDLQDNTGNKVSVKGIPFAFAPPTGLISFKIILEMMLLIRSLNGKDSLHLEIIYTKAKVKIYIEYPGTPIDFGIRDEINGKFSACTKSSIQERLKLINGTLHIKNRNINHNRIGILIEKD